MSAAFSLSLSALQSVIAGAKIIGPPEGSADLCVTGFTTDSRKVLAGDMFLALRGERFAAHDFLNEVIAQGAAAVVIDHMVDGLTVPALLVPDTKIALADIARYWRRQFDLPIIGVTGSNGKTTVKEMISAILAAHVGAEQRLATTGNLNNEIGVPLTALRLRAQHRAAVIELGMNHPGEIALIVAVAEPTVGLVNNAQREHQEFMQSVQAVAEENGAVLRQLPVNGTAVFPADDAYALLWRGYATKTGQRQVLTFGLFTNADVHATYHSNATGSDLNVAIGIQQFRVQLSALGEHNVMNALAAIACTHAIGVPHAVIAQGLQNFSPVNGRLQRKLAIHGDSAGATVIDDTYNANPDSVLAAIDVLAKIDGATMLVLGDMGEVGAEGVAFHREIGAYAKQSGVTRLLTLGELAQHATAAFGEGARHFTQIDALVNVLDATLAHADTALIKGSRFMKMERVVAHLTQAVHESPSTTGTH